jgi:hypothetical protein
MTKGVPKASLVRCLTPHRSDLEWALQALNARPLTTLFPVRMNDDSEIPYESLPIGIFDLAHVNRC